MMKTKLLYNWLDGKIDDTDQIEKLNDLSFLRSFLQDNISEIMESSSPDIKDKLFSKIEKVFNLKIMSIGSNCADIFATRFADTNKSYFRIKGPIDNTESINGLANVECLLRKTILQDTIEKPMNITKLERNVRDNDYFENNICTVRTDFGKFVAIHNDFRQERTVVEFKKRVSVLYNYLDNIKDNPNHFLMYSLGFNDYEEDGTFKKCQFISGLDLLEQYGLKDKVIFISCGESIMGDFMVGHKEDLLEIDSSLNVVEGSVYTYKDVIEKCHGTGTLKNNLLTFLINHLTV